MYKTKLESPSRLVAWFGAAVYVGKILINTLWVIVPMVWDMIKSRKGKTNGKS